VRENQKQRTVPIVFPYTSSTLISKLFAILRFPLSLLRGQKSLLEILPIPRYTEFGWWFYQIYNPQGEKYEPFP
jgi:hypothetical protein